jgi:uncharacterized protein YndB with AHSA1/START domain
MLMPGTRENAAKLTLVGDRQLRIERILNAPRERVWRALTEPELIAQWWGRGNMLEVERMEVRPGGHWRFVERAKGQSHGFEGRYREIRPPELLELTFEWDGAPGHSSVDTYTLEDLGDGRTRLVTNTLFMTAEDRSGMLSSGAESGINESYDALDRLLAKLGQPH